MPYVSKKRLNALQLAGNMCSNVCYNLSQHKDFPSHISTSSMAESFKAWDAAKLQLFIKPTDGGKR
jgi:hypothetical protein